LVRGGVHFFREGLLAPTGWLDKPLDISRVRLRASPVEPDDANERLLELLVGERVAERVDGTVEVADPVGDVVESGSHGARQGPVLARKADDEGRIRRFVGLSFYVPLSTQTRSFPVLMSAPGLGLGRLDITSGKSRSSSSSSSCKTVLPTSLLV